MLDTWNFVFDVLSVSTREALIDAQLYSVEQACYNVLGFAFFSTLALMVPHSTALPQTEGCDFS
jgi:hypothetical protein